MTTVTGPVSSAGLGLTLTHEHLSNDLRAAVTEPDDPSLAFLRHARTEPGLAWLLREQPYACLDHCRLDDAPAVLADLRAFAEAGGGTVVDVTPDGIGRDPLALRSLAERSGLRIVMGSGWYLERHHPAGLSRADERTLAAGLVAEFADGARGTGVRPGVIGEIGVSADFTPASTRRCGPPRGRSARPASRSTCTCRAGGAARTRCSTSSSATTESRPAPSCCATWTRPTTTRLTRTPSPSAASGWSST